MKRLIKILVESRVRLGLSQSHIARQLNVTSAVISRLESEQTESPAFRDIVLYGIVCGLSPNAMAKIADLYHGPEDVAPSDPRFEQLIALFGKLPPEHQDELMNLLLMLTQSRVQAFGEPLEPWS